MWIWKIQSWLHAHLGKIWGEPKKFFNQNRKIPWFISLCFGLGISWIVIIYFQMERSYSDLTRTLGLKSGEFFFVGLEWWPPAFMHTISLVWRNMRNNIRFVKKICRFFLKGSNERRRSSWKECLNVILVSFNFLI